MRKSYTAEFKSKVALEAIKEESTITDIGSKYKIHPNQVINWKKQFLGSASKLFVDKRTAKGKKQAELKEEQLYKAIGKLQVENEFLRKKYEKFYGKQPD